VLEKLTEYKHRAPTKMECYQRAAVAKRFWKKARNRNIFNERTQKLKENLKSQ
jgi:hypothetical protein